MRLLARFDDEQFFGSFLEPVDRAVFSIDAQAMAVEVADRHLARPQTTARAAREAQQQVDVVVDRASGNYRRHVGRDLGDLLARDELDELEGMRADVAESARAGELRIGAPARLLLPGLLD